MRLLLKGATYYNYGHWGLRNGPALAKDHITRAAVTLTIVVQGEVSKSIAAISHMRLGPKATTGEHEDGLLE